MDFDDDSRAIINDDFSVTYTDRDGSAIISGFPSRADAQSFCYFGDFDQKNNDYVLITKPVFSLHWTYD